MTKTISVFSIFLSLTAVLSLNTACQNSKPQVAEEIQFSDTGIINGSPVSIDEEIAKHVVGIGMNQQPGVFCTGVLVAKNLVVTAAHCTGATMYPNEMFIVFGTDLRGQVIKRQVQGGKVTEDWPKLDATKEKDWGDIALLRFEDQAPEGYSPIRLLGSSELLHNGMEVTLAGYGLTNMRPQRDPGKLMKTDVILTNSAYAATEIQFDQIDGKGACHGDSGGPAFARVNNKLFLIGVTSRSATESGGRNCLEGSIYTSVPGQIEFLRNTARFLNSKNFVPNEKIPQPAE